MAEANDDRTRSASHPARGCAGCHIGLIAGTPLKADRLLCFVDVDCPGLIRCAKAIVAPFVCGKRGSKGETIFAQAVTGLKSAKLRPKGTESPTVEVFIASGYTAIPPSGHPSGCRYE